MTKRVVPRGGIVALLTLSFALGLGGCGESLYDKEEAPPEKVDGDVVLQPGHEPAGAGDRPILIRLVHHAQAIAGRRSRYLSSVSG